MKRYMWNVQTEGDGVCNMGGDGTVHAVKKANDMPNYGS